MQMFFDFVSNKSYFTFICFFFVFSCSYANLEAEQEKHDGCSSICIIGDSISTFKDYLVSEIPGYDGAKYEPFYPKGDVNSIEKTWWFIVADRLGIDRDHIVNCSWSGSTVTGDAFSTVNAGAACSIRRIRDVSAKGFIPDIVLCYISCNDWAYNYPIGNWIKGVPFVQTGVVLTLREAYALMLSRLKETYPDSRIFCLTILDDTRRDKTPGWPSNNSNSVSIEEWNRNIVEVAGIMECDVIDLHGCGISYESCPAFTLDGLHPNAAGMRLMAKTVLEGLKRLY